jgi:hypothetical protein
VRVIGWLGAVLLAAAVVAACTQEPAPEQSADEPATEEAADEPGDPGTEAAADEAAEPEAAEPAEPEEARAADDVDPAREQRRGAPLPTARTEVTGTAWDGQVVAIGGLDENGAALANVDLYDPATDTWTAGPDLPEALHHTAVETLGDRLFVVGGYTIRQGAWVAETAVWSLGPGEEAWREEPPLTTPRGALAIASTGSRLVALGGVGPGREVLTSTEVLELDGDGWMPGPELDTPREHLDATAVGDEVYAISGRAGGLDTNHASVEVLRDGAWHLTAPVVHPRGGIGADTVRGVPCVTGGEEPGGTIGTIECLVDHSWETVGELEIARHGLVVAAVDGELHVIGGGPEPGLTISDVHEIVPIHLPGG